MGKGSKSLTFVSDKKVKRDIKQQQLQKVKKSNNAIKKLKPKEKEQLKSDYEELKALLRLDDSTMTDQTNTYPKYNNDGMQVDTQTSVKD